MAMALGVAVASGIAMTRALTGISILPFLIVGYVISVILSFHCPNIFSTIAFDAGGVASGVMAATFLLPLSIGVCAIRDATPDMIMIDAFGTIALVAMTPTVSIQIVGIIYKIKLSHSKTAEADDGDILILESLGEEYLSTLSDGADIPLNTQALGDYDDDFEIIEFDVENG